VGRTKAKVRTKGDQREVGILEVMKEQGLHWLTHLKGLEKSGDRKDIHRQKQLARDMRVVCAEWLEAG
jgi:hypothetical protein